MKRILSLVLVLAMSLCLFAGCGKDPAPTAAAGATLADAKDYLYAMYKDNAEVTAVNFSVVGTVMISGETFNVAWSVDNDAIKIVANGKFFNIEIPKSVEEISYKLTATISDAAGNKETVTFSYKVPAAAGLPASIADGTYVILAGNLTMSSLTQDKGYGYPTANEVTVEGGAVSGHFKADVLTITNVDGGVTIQDAYGRYFYLKGTYNSFNVDATAPAEGHIWEVLQNGEHYIFVNKTNGKTLAYSASYTSWGAYPELTDDYTTLLSVIPAVAPETDPEKPVDPDTPVVPEVPSTGMVTAPVAGTAYKLGLVHGGKGNAIYYLTGAEKPNYPWYLLSTTNEAEAVDVFVEEVDGGLRLYFMASGVKTYVDMHKDGTHYSLRLTTEPTAVYTWNTEYNTFVATVDDKDCFIGTYNTYDTFSCNKMDGIATSYPVHLYGEGGAGETPENPTEKPATLAEQIAEANKLANKEYLPYESTITGTITDDPMASSKNEGSYKFTVSDGTNTLLCYFVTVNGGVPQKGDTVTVTGYLTAYNGTAQFSEGYATATLGGATETPENPETPIEKPATLAEQIAEANKLANKEYLPYESTITGTIIDDPMASSKNAGCYKFTVSDGTNTLLCYFIAVNGGVPHKGDTVTVTGKLTAYNGAAQFGEGVSTATLIATGETPVEPEQPEQPELEITGTATRVEAVVLGDKIVLVNQAGDSAMGAQNDKKRDIAAVAVTDNTASLTAGVVIITLEAGTQEGTFALKVADGYLAYANNGNAISTQETVDDAASWIITFTDGVVSIQNVAYAERFLQYNISAPRFVCYKGTQEAPVIYKVEE